MKRQRGLLKIKQRIYKWLTVRRMLEGRKEIRPRMMMGDI